ncbi:MAG: DUF2249 domain-containing protein [Actinomycetota bacterium]|nr:DUF2249 domain-containing protein [Actinomycetota bacterium]
MMKSAQALEAMLGHHAALEEGVSRRVATIQAGGGGASLAELLAYMASEVLPHAVAEEQTIYKVAAEREELAETIAGMVDEHRQLSAHLDRLATADEGAAATEAKAIEVLFREHVAKENELILPVLAADPVVHLGDLLEEMHHSLESAAGAEAEATDSSATDVEAALLRLLLDGATDLATAGEGDRACRLAAEAWTVVRAWRPELGVKVTASLHKLVRSVTAEPVKLSSGPGRPGARENSTLDVRRLAPAQRHETIFATYAGLEPGTGFILVNDHDPKPLRYQFEAEHSGEFTWDVIEAGPAVWRIRVGRSATAAG